MSLNYASSLSPYANKGKCGIPELSDSIDLVKSKCEQLASWIQESKWTVAITGAGLSTSCGIPDFRGPNGVWTLEKKGLKPETNISFDSAKPSYAHYALVELNRMNKLNFLISQNIDGLHMRSGFPFNRLAELHGNMFVEKCHSCLSKHIKIKCVSTIGLKPTGKKCLKPKPKGYCRGELHDTILDWEDDLPSEDMQKSEANCKKADLCLCLGTSLQIMPVGNYPLLTKKNNNGKIVIINLQPTRMDKNADLVINYKLDDVFKILFESLMKIKFNYENVCTDYAICLKLDHDLDDDPLLITSSNTVVDAEYKIKTEIKKEIKSEPETTTKEPNLILLFSGKRKSGKDFICQKLVESLKAQSSSFSISLVTLSAPLKEIYAAEHNLDYEKLLDSSDYKEKYRLDMINWSDAKRKEDPSYFCEKAVEKTLKELNESKQSMNKFSIWIITDARRQTDLNYFKNKYLNLVKTVRVVADESVRIERNWKFTQGVDDSISECDLDSIKDWDFIINNNNDTDFIKCLDILIDHVNKIANISKS